MVRLGFVVGIVIPVIFLGVNLVLGYGGVLVSAAPIVLVRGPGVLPPAPQGRGPAAPPPTQNPPPPPPARPPSPRRGPRPRPPPKRPPPAALPGGRPPRAVRTAGGY